MLHECGTCVKCVCKDSLQSATHAVSPSPILLVRVTCCTVSWYMTEYDARQIIIVQCAFHDAMQGLSK